MKEEPCKKQLMVAAGKRLPYREAQKRTPGALDAGCFMNYNIKRGFKRPKTGCATCSLHLETERWWPLGPQAGILNTVDIEEDL